MTRCPRGARPRVRVMFVLAPDSSMNTPAAWGPRPSTARASAGVARPRPAAPARRRAATFFKHEPQFAEPPPDGAHVHRRVEPLTQFLACGAGVSRHQLTQPRGALVAQAARGPGLGTQRLQRVAFPQDLSDPAGAGAARAEHLRDLLGLLALLVQFNHPLAQTYRISLHATTSLWRGG